MLIGQQIHSRDREAIMEFSHPYYLNAERMVVTQDSPYTILTDLANLPVSVEIGSRSERALRDFSERTGVTFDIRTYFSESEALDALANGEVQGMLGELDNLLRAGRQQMRLIDEPVLIEPYAIAMRHGDINLRNILNRSLQRLKASGRMDQIFNSWFSGTNPNWNFTLLIPVYETLYGDERSLSQFNTDMPTAANPIAQRIRDGQPIRVAGIYSEGETAPAGIRFISSLNRAMIEEMARRWNAKIEYIPNSALNAADLVANGQADIAVGISPRWDGADRVEYSRPYIEHSDRLMVPARSDITGFSDMLGTRWRIGFFADDAPDEQHIQQNADTFRVGQNISTFSITREDQGIYTMVVEDNIRAIYGDSLRLMALQQEESDPSVVKILDHPYGDILPITLAVPRGDVEFLDVVDATLQAMAQDGTYQNLWSANFGQGTPLTIVTWPEKNPDPQ
jgi:ABC-type amino acid transport substrate-binding protein